MLRSGPVKGWSTDAVKANHPHRRVARQVGVCLIMLVFWWCCSFGLSLSFRFPCHRIDIYPDWIGMLVLSITMPTSNLWFFICHLGSLFVDLLTCFLACLLFLVLTFAFSSPLIHRCSPTHYSPYQKKTTTASFYKASLLQRCFLCA